MGLLIPGSWVPRWARSGGAFAGGPRPLHGGRQGRPRECSGETRKGQDLRGAPPPTHISRGKRNCRGERVLCFHGPLLYEAKCVKVAIKDKQVKYFIHYSGWNKNWDEWVPESRVLKYVDTNLQKQKELQKANQEQYAEGKMRGAAPGKKTSGLQQKNVEVFFRRDGAHTVCSLETPTISTRKTKKNKQKTPGIGEGGSTSENPQPPRKKRARVDPTVESEETFMNRVEVKVKIPEELKPWLVDDWDLITRQKQLFYLPAKKNVDSILEDYANYKKSRGNTDNKEYAVNEVVAGIKEYFNVMLGTQLLYKFERPQYAEILADHPDAPMSQVYGAPHLLRLFVRIGAMLAYTPLDEKSLALLLNYLHDFLKYLAKNSSTLFSASDYEVAPPEYHRKAV
ncbi:mortality factor 4-like protein 1 isoform X2 [Hemicordylus capensis]|uniref:mortality factor 4-like protein 1 isoform X1 n=1 Tax=Hemicordylus capensis TaxID=884348 RepID=UPI0023035709|nr:mortality factor 4-like protein 1 isoform X1 [Hemicordylus capensis]XP_053127685.1 mortality factor 4-like protein 1 isoform X2 [Hemicordylus capensis]